MAQEHNGGSGERRGHYGNGNGRGNGHYGKGRGPSRPGRGGKPGYGHEGRGGKGGFRKDGRKSDGFRAEGAGEGGEERRDFHKSPRPARPAGARPPLEERYPGLAALSACDDEGKAKVLRDVLDGLRRELDEEQA